MANDAQDAFFARNGISIVEETAERLVIKFKNGRTETLVAKRPDLT